MGKNSNEKKSIMQGVGDLKNILPAEFTNTPTMEIVGNRELTIDCCRGIVEYSDYAVKIKTSGGIISVGGQRLNIKYLSINSVVIEGKILDIEFIDWR